LDIPIGLTDKGSRNCDLQARRLLKAGRASSVFPAPIRSVLSAVSREQASQLRFEAEGKRMTVQAWAIVGKIREVDAILQADTEIRNKVREERRNLLMSLFNDDLESTLAHRRKFRCAYDFVVYNFI
jgi:predicted RNase H-like nuclease